MLLSYPHNFPTPIPKYAIVIYRSALDTPHALCHHPLMEQHDTALPSTALGFGPTVGPIIDAASLPVLNETTDADVLAEAIRQKSLVRVDHLSDLLAARAIDPSATSKLLLDTIEQNIKLSGLTAKQQAKEVVGTGYQLVINIGAKSETFGGVTVEQLPANGGTDADV